MPEKRKKRAPRPIDFNIFYDEQKTAVDLILDYQEGRTPYRIITFRGYAGTGKTFVMSNLQDYWLYAKKLKIAFTAPTNKAVMVAKDMCEIGDSNLTFSTLHKLLGLKEYRDENGRLRFIPDPHNPPSLEAYDVLVVDEGSQLDDYLFGLINPFVEKGLRIIIVGDPAQIPPVNKVDCIPFIRKKQLEYNIGVTDLVHVRRQGLDNPILEYATAVRMQRREAELDYDFDVKLHNGTGIIPIYKDAKDVIKHICEVYYANPIFEQYPDFMKIVAYHNKVINGVNRKIRTLIYKEDKLPLLMFGEKLIADEPIKTQEQFTLTTNSEFIVRDYQIGSTKYVGTFRDNVIVRETFKYYHTTVEAITDRGLRQYRMWIIHEDSYNNYMLALEEFKRFVFTKDGNERKEAWREYYKLYNFFAKVKYNYAITSHKAQGSTYENTIMLDWDIQDNWKVEERNRIRYVAATRARKYLFIVK